MDEAGPNLIFSIFINLGLIFIYAFYTVTESVLISSDKERLRDMADEGNKRAKKLLEISENHSEYLSHMNVLRMFIGFFLIIFNTERIEKNLLVSLTGFSGLSDRLIFIFIEIFLVILMVILLMVFGYFIPKRVVVKNPDKFALKFVGFINLGYKLVKAIVFIARKLSNFILKISKISTGKTEMNVTIEEIKSLIELGQRQGLLDLYEKDMINAIMSFSDKTAEEVMTARTEVFAIDVDDDIDNYLNELLEYKYSRIPVYEENIDNILGIVYFKDFMLEMCKNHNSSVDLRKIIKPAYFILETKNINDLFVDMKKDKSHMAILIDEYGGFSGLVTMEDLIEEIVGNIEDEFDKEAPEVVKVDKFNYLVKGNAAINEINSVIGLDLDEDSDDFDTIGGMLIHNLGYVPEDGEKKSVTIDRVVYKIINVEDKRIKKVKVVLAKNFYD